MICILMAHKARREAPGNMYSTTTCCKYPDKLSIFKNIVTDGEWNPETPVVRIDYPRLTSLSTIREEREKQRLYNASGMARTGYILNHRTCPSLDWVGVAVFFCLG
jgi:hypothetical protein